MYIIKSLIEKKPVFITSISLVLAILSIGVGIYFGMTSSWDAAESSRQLVNLNNLNQELNNKLENMTSQLKQAKYQIDKLQRYAQSAEDSAAYSNKALTSLKKDSANLLLNFSQQKVKMHQLILKNNKAISAMIDKGEYLQQDNEELHDMIRKFLKKNQTVKKTVKKRISAKNKTTTVTINESSINPPTRKIIQSPDDDKVKTFDVELSDTTQGEHLAIPTIPEIRLKHQ